MNITASKQIWDPNNPLPCINLSFGGSYADGNLSADWEKWVDFCNENKKADWIIWSRNSTGEISSIDYEESLSRVSKWVLIDFIDFLAEGSNVRYGDKSTYLYELDEDNLNWLSTKVNRNPSQIQFLFQLVDGDFEKLKLLETKIKNCFYAGCPTTVEEVNRILQMKQNSDWFEL